MKRHFSSRGAIHGCILILGILAIFTFIVFLCFYVFIWKVPDRSAQAEPILIKVEDRLNRRAAFPPEKNSWTYYKKAIDKINLSKVMSSPSPSMSPNFGYNPADYEIVSQLTKLTLDEKSQKEIALLKELAKTNAETLALVDKGFQQPGFSLGTPGKPVGFGVNGFPDYIKLQMFLMYLTKTGDFEKARGDYQAAAKRYLESIYLEEMIKQDTLLTINMRFNGISSYSNLRDLIDKCRGKRKELSYLSQHIQRIPRYTVADYLEIQYYTIETSLTSSGNQAPPGTPASMTSGAPAFIRERERRILQGLTVDALDVYAKDSSAFLDNFKPDIKAKFSLIGAYMNIMMEQQYESINLDLVNLNGLRILTALQLYHSDHGKYPAKLENLVPNYLSELPADPFAKDGKYIFNITDGKLLFYSIGPDKKDDKGKTNIEQYYENGDIVFAGPATEVKQKAQPVKTTLP